MGLSQASGTELEARLVTLQTKLVGVCRTPHLAHPASLCLVQATLAHSADVSCCFSHVGRSSWAVQI
eukprot:5467722-Amphidinium_carterae.1